MNNFPQLFPYAEQKFLQKKKTQKLESSIQAKIFFSLFWASLTKIKAKVIPYEPTMKKCIHLSVHN